MQTKKVVDGVSSKIVTEQKRPLNILVLVVVQPLQFPMRRKYTAQQ